MSELSPEQEVKALRLKWNRFPMRKGHYHWDYFVRDQVRILMRHQPRLGPCNPPLWWISVHHENNAIKIVERCRSAAQAEDYALRLFNLLGEVEESGWLGSALKWETSGEGGRTFSGGHCRYHTAKSKSTKCNYVIFESWSANEKSPDENNHYLKLEIKHENQGVRTPDASQNILNALKDAANRVNDSGIFPEVSCDDG